MDFTTVADKLPSTQIIQVFADSQNGNAGYYVPVQGTALNIPAVSPATSCKSPSPLASCNESIAP
jgi:hypothetical protein